MEEIVNCKHGNNLMWKCSVCYDETNAEITQLRAEVAAKSEMVEKLLECLKSSKRFLPSYEEYLIKKVNEALKSHEAEGAPGPLEDHPEARMGEEKNG